MKISRKVEDGRWSLGHSKVETEEVDLKTLQAAGWEETQTIEPYISLSLPLLLGPRPSSWPSPCILPCLPQSRLSLDNLTPRWPLPLLLVSGQRATSSLSAVSQPRQRREPRSPPAHLSACLHASSQPRSQCFSMWQAPKHLLNGVAEASCSSRS